MSQSGKSGSGGGGGGSGITTINGDQGPAVTPIAGVVKISGQLSGASVAFDGNASGSNPNELDLKFTDRFSNTYLGNECGAASGNFPDSNTAVGFQAMASVDSAFNNVAVGANSLQRVVNGFNHVAVGLQALSVIPSGSSNVAIGTGAGSSYDSNESSNIVINNEGVEGESNVLRIGSGTGTGDQQLNSAFISGITGITVVGAAVLVSAGDQLGVAVSSRKYKENIQDLGSLSEDIFNLRPVAFNYIAGDDKTQQTGLIAEEVHQVMPSLVVYDKNGEPQTVKYHELPVLLLNEIKKLREEINQLKGK